MKVVEHDELVAMANADVRGLLEHVDAWLDAHPLGPDDLEGLVFRIEALIGGAATLACRITGGPQWFAGRRAWFLETAARAFDVTAETIAKAQEDNDGAGRQQR